MDVDEIKRPVPILCKTDAKVLELCAPSDVRNENGELTDIRIAPALLVARESTEITDTSVSEIAELFNEYTYLLGKMVRLAELNADTLAEVVTAYFQLYPPAEIVERNAACRKLPAKKMDDEFNKLTFGNLRNIISCIVKTDTDLHTIEELRTQKLRSNFTKVYQNYIRDRDVYTHGILYFVMPEKTAVLRSMKKGEKIYLRVDREIFRDNLRTYKYLTTVLTEIKSRLQTNEPVV